MRHRALSFLAAVLLFAASSAVPAHPYSDVFVFGDSLADSGNNAVLVDGGMFPGFAPGDRTAVPLVPPEIIPTVPYASNRYSNGPVWTEYFAQSLGLSAGPALIPGNTNFAFGGARSGPGFAPGVPTLVDQAGMFLGATGGLAPAGALYVVQGGGNDARDILGVAAGGGDPMPLIGDFAANIANVVDDLQAAGARDFLIANVPDIGKAPAVLGLGAGAQGSFIASLMNDALDTALGALTLEAGSRFYRLDLFGLMNQVAGGLGGFDALSVCALSQLCIDNPAGVFFWDGIHPTTAGHAFLGMQAAALVPEPQTYALLLAGLLIVVARLRRA